MSKRISAWTFLTLEILLLYLESARGDELPPNTADGISDDVLSYNNATVGEPKNDATVVALNPLTLLRKKKITAYCVFNSGSGGISASLTLSQNKAGGPVTITGQIAGLTPKSKHGFHVHEKADFSDGCESTGSHYNPFNHNHGAPTDKDRHVGDLGNVKANSDGTATVKIVDKVISLRNGITNIIGRAFVLHQNVDDLGRGGTELSNTTGNAGARIACGKITAS